MHLKAFWSVVVFHCVPNLVNAAIVLIAIHSISFLCIRRSIAILDHVSKQGHNVYLSRHIRCGKTVFGLRSNTWTLRCDSSVRIMFLALSALFHQIYRFVCVSVQAESATATNKYAQLYFVISDAIIHTRCHTHTHTHTHTHHPLERERLE